MCGIPSRYIYVVYAITLRTAREILHSCNNDVPYHVTFKMIIYKSCCNIKFNLYVDKSTIVKTHSKPQNTKYDVCVCVCVCVFKYVIGLQHTFIFNAY